MDLLTIIAIVLIILWLAGVSTIGHAGGLIHLLVVVALVIFVVRLLQHRQL